MLRTAWNRIRYTLYSPIYDAIATVFAPKRALSIAQLELKPDASILIIGAGTGLDLPFLKDYSNITATDLTPAMLQILKRRAKNLEMEVEALVMDGQNLKFQNDTFDAVILHLILAVMPDPYQCIKEVERVLKPEGQVVIFDKFLPNDQKAGLFRKGLNLLTNLLATTINRQTSVILEQTNFQIKNDQKVGWNGILRILKLKKPK